MANYSISDTTLTALGDAVRKHAGETREVLVPLENPIIRNFVYEDIAQKFVLNDSGRLNYIDEIRIKGMNRAVVNINFHLLTSSSGVEVDVDYGDHHIILHNNINHGLSTHDLSSSSDTLVISLILNKAIYDMGKYTDYRVDFEIYAYDADGNLITEKEVSVKNTMTPMQMANKINDFNLVPTEGYVVKGNCSYRFSNNGWNWYINTFGENIKTENIQNMTSMFINSSNLEKVPFVINAQKNYNLSCSSMFDGCSKLETAPKILNLKANNISDMFADCKRLKEIPLDYTDTWNWQNFDTATSAYNADTGNVFEGCYSMRRFPVEWLEHGNPVATYSYSWYYYMACYGYAFDEITNIPFPHYNATWTSNAFSSTFNQCGRAKNITFKLQDDGTPYVMSGWKSQTIDLTQYVGYEVTATSITSWNSGLTAETQITDAASYQALKDNPDSWTANIDYSRYNHDSAVNTINSLPDVSGSGGTNTIKFKKASGALTDGGAISSLTQEEIAVAAAKGWTVTLS